MSLVAYMSSDTIEHEGRSTTHHPSRVRVVTDDDRLVAIVEELDDGELVVRVGPCVSITTASGESLL